MRDRSETTDPPVERPVAWHALSSEEAASELGADLDGLDADEVERRRDRYGPNQLEGRSGPSPLSILLGQVTSPLIAILVVAGVVALAVGEVVDAAFIGVVLLVNTVLGFVQEFRAESSIRSLMELASPTATVLRDDQEQEVDAADVVPGDVVVLVQGSRVPADVRITDADGLELDESLLTGESTVARKGADATDEDADLADRLGMAYLGTTVAAGKGRGLVVATGMASELGAIAASVQGEEGTTTPLQQRLDRFARVIAVAVGVAAVVTFGLGVLTGEGLTEMFLTAVTLAVAAVPEGLPVAFTVALALGVRRMARRRSVIRRLPAVETLGSTTVICSDKTGTLTRNRMTVEHVWGGGCSWYLDEEADELVAEDPDATTDVLEAVLATGVLTNDAELPEGDAGDGEDDGEEGAVEEEVGDPTEVALLHAARRGGLDVADVRASRPVHAERPFDPTVLYSMAARDEDGTPVLHLKGATEPLLEHCSAMLGPDGEEVDLDLDQVREQMEQMADEGLRVLAMARGTLSQAPDDADDLAPEDLVLLGLQGMMDPPRDGVAEAIDECGQAGIRVVVITGDHARTATAIARELDLGGDDEVVTCTGREVEELSDEELQDRVGETDVFARMTPEHKLRVVHALQEAGEVVTVTGDGVNDAPALKAAEIGVAMGRSGTDVAREAAEMVLTDDDFVSIRHAVEEGRRTFAIVRQVTFFLVSTGAGAVLAIVGGIGLGWSLPLVPAQILWLNVVTNGFQDVALAFERGEGDHLHRPPRDLDEGLLSRTLWERTALVAVVMGLGTLALFGWSEQADGLEQGRSVALTALVVLSAVLVYSSRSEHTSVWRMNPLGNPFLLAAQAGALALHVAALHTPLLQGVLRVEPITAGAWGAILAAAVVALIASEVHKAVRRPRTSGAERHGG